MSSFTFYLITIGIFFCIYCIQGWGLNIQFGATGILNFALIAFVAIGAYFAGVTALAPSTGGGMAGKYIMGWHLPFPVPPVLGGVAAGLVGLLVAIVAMRRLRSDYLAIVMVSVQQILWFISGNDTHLFNGWDGISGVPQPLNSLFNLSYTNYSYVFLVICVIAAGLGYIISEALLKSPYGRVLRAIREDEDVAAALGKNIFRYKVSAFIMGCVFIGVSGALTIEYVGSYNPSAWVTAETFLIWAALLVGGKGNNRGVLLGALAVPVLFNEATRFIPQIPAHPQLIDSLRMVAVGLLMILVSRFRPDGFLPERKVRFDVRGVVANTEKGRIRHVV